jgi:hypothetical protein
VVSRSILSWRPISPLVPEPRWSTLNKLILGLVTSFRSLLLSNQFFSPTAAVTRWARIYIRCFYKINADTFYSVSPVSLQNGRAHCYIMGTEGRGHCGVYGCCVLCVLPLIYRVIKAHSDDPVVILNNRVALWTSNAAGIVKVLTLILSVNASPV